MDVQGKELKTSQFLNLFKMTNRFNVYIIRTDGDIAISMTGEDMGENQAYRREFASYTNLNGRTHSALACEIGSDLDQRYSSQLSE